MRATCRSPRSSERRTAKTFMPLRKWLISFALAHSLIATEHKMPFLTSVVGDGWFSGREMFKRKRMCQYISNRARKLVCILDELLFAH